MPSSCQIPIMRYAHIVRKSAPTDYDRRYSVLPLYKRANTFALDIRTVLLSIFSVRTPYIVCALITAPFLIALVLYVINPHASVANTVLDIPHNFRKYDYHAIRAGHVKHIHRKTVSIALDQFQAQLLKRRKWVDHGKGVSLIAACKDRKESLGLSLPSWEAISHISEIIIVDWSSQTPPLDLPHIQPLLESGRLKYVRVTNGGQWVLSRAYNLAAQLANGRYLLKVDCDTHLDPRFLSVHQPPSVGVYYTVSWGSERNVNEQSLRGVWYARRHDFLTVGGYDERITTFGYEDTDLYHRFHTKAGLRIHSFDLDTVRHNVAGHVVFRQTDNSTVSRRVSKRMNKALLEGAMPWEKLVENHMSTTYEYSTIPGTYVLFASVVQLPPSPTLKKTQAEQKQMTKEVLQKALHDEYKIPWDILPSLTYTDLHYLAAYLDRDTPSHILVVELAGPDLLSNIFNLISAIQLGITLSRPVIVVYPPPTNSSPRMDYVRLLIDLDATNELLRQTERSEIAKRHSFSGATRLISAEKWPCVEALDACAEKYDRAYASFSKVSMKTRRVYDEREPVPISVKLHGFVRLRNLTKIGNEETRGLAFGALVFTKGVREALSVFGLNPRVGIVASGDMNLIVAEARKRGLSVEGGKIVPVVGKRAVEVRGMISERYVGGFCGSVCGLKEMMREMANVLALVRAKVVVPSVSVGDREGWIRGVDVAGMMVADLRALHKAKPASGS